MGVSIWYVPDSSDRAVKIDCGDYLTDLEERPDVLAFGAESLSGLVSRTILRSRLRVRIAIERFTSTTLERNLRTLETHLDRGGSCAVARVESKAWAGYTTGGRPARTTSLATRGNTWSFGQTASLTAGDEVCLWGGTPESIREYDSVSSFTSPTVVLTNGLRNAFDQGPILVRHRDYFPCLRRPIGETTPIVTHERRIVHTLEMDLVEDTYGLAVAASWGPGVLPTTSGSSGAQSPDLRIGGALRVRAKS